MSQSTEVKVSTTPCALALLPVALAAGTLAVVGSGLYLAASAMKDAVNIMADDIRNGRYGINLPLEQLQISTMSLDAVGVMPLLSHQGYQVEKRTSVLASNGATIEVMKVSRGAESALLVPTGNGLGFIAPEPAFLAKLQNDCLVGKLEQALTQLEYKKIEITPQTIGRIDVVATKPSIDAGSCSPQSVEIGVKDGKVVVHTQRAANCDHVAKTLVAAVTGGAPKKDRRRSVLERISL